MPVRKGTLFIPSGGADHLHIVMNDPVFDPIAGHELVLAANVSTIYEGRAHDSSCVLNVGDHPFIRHPSYISYRHADLYRADGLAAKIASGEVTQGVDISEQIFQTILAGFNRSPFVLRKVERFIKLHKIS